MTVETPDPAGRRVLVLAHTGRAEVREVARACVQRLTEHGIAVRLLADEAADLGLDPGPGAEGLVETTQPDDLPGEGCELVLVIGGDGSILRAAELTHETSTPLLGVNLGHVGFLAEAEPEDVEFTIAAIVDRAYTAEDRLTLGVTVLVGKEVAVRDLRPQRGQRREGRPRADARGRRRGRRATAVEVGLRRRRVRHPDRVDRLQLQRRRARWCGPRSRPC